MSDIKQFDNLSQALTYYVNSILTKNKVISANSKNQDTYKSELIELHPIFFELKNPKKVVLNHRDFKIIPYWAVSEILTELLGMNPPIMVNYRKDIVGWSYNLLESGRSCYQYGSRWLNHNTLEKTLDRLKKNPTSKRCVVPIFDQNDVGETLDAPCNTSFMFLIRDNKLDLSLICRSIDITKGFRYDPILFSFIQQSFASFLKVEVGSLYYFCNSLHCYGKDIDKLKALKLYLNYHENECLELEIDKGMEMCKYYDDLRLVSEIEVLSRNYKTTNIQHLLDKINYKFARDFGRVYVLKNGASNLQTIDYITNQIETPSIKSWFCELK